MKVTHKDSTSLVEQKFKKMKKKPKCVPYEMLMEYSMETCELCLSIFHNKLDKYIHNAEHMIIPLRRNFSCLKCNSLFSKKSTFTEHNCMKLDSKNVTDKSQDSIKTDCTQLDEIVKQVNVKLPIEYTDLKTALLKDMFVKKPIVKCDNFIANAILNKKKDIHVKLSIKEPLLKDFCLKQLVVKCKNDYVVNKIVSTSKETDTGTSDIEITTKLNESGFQPEMSKTETDNSCQVTTVAKCEDEIVISDSESNTSLDKCLEKYNQRIDTNLVSITKLESTNYVDCKKEDYLPHLYYEDSNDFDFVSEYVNEADAKLEICDELEQEPVNEGLKDFIKNEMKAKDFEMLYKSEVALSDSLQTKIIFEDDPDDFLNNDLILSKKDSAFNLDRETVKYCYESIHCSDLKYEESVSCKYCSKIFPNMYDLIIHETKHLKFKSHSCRAPLCPVCNIYIAGNYRALTKHILINHPLKHITKPEKYKCSECNLSYYNYNLHSKHYHRKRICYLCQERFYDKKRFEQHVCGRNDEVQRPKPVIKGWKQYDRKLCEVCSMFLCHKYFKYVYVGSLCEVGKTFQCDQCNKNFFEVKKYFRSSLNSKVGRNKTKSKATETDERKNRLKNIWKRLKHIKYVSNK